MTATDAALRQEALRSFERAWPWLAYAVGLLLVEVGYQDAGAYVFMLGMLRHWKAWLLFFVTFALGWAWASRKPKC